MGGGWEAGDDSETAGDWAATVDEKTNVKARPPENLILPNLTQFLMPMRVTFRAGTTQD